MTRITKADGETPDKCSTPPSAEGTAVDDFASIVGFILLGFTWLTLRSMDDRRPRSDTRR